MGRELRRVPLDFDWPEKKVWRGYVNPHYAKSRDCPECDGSGSSPGARMLSGQWYGDVRFNPVDRGSAPFSPNHLAVLAFARRNLPLAAEYFVRVEADRLAVHFNRGWSHHLNADDVAALVAAGRLMDFTHTWTPESGWKPKDPPYHPTPEEVNLWSISGGMGHDPINQWVVVEAECKRKGIDPTCHHCQGSGTLWVSPEDEAAAEAWEQTEPPAGDGYQIWETVSDGSPISPVFPTPESLAEYMTGRAWGGDRGSSYDSWLRFINGPGWAPSTVCDDTGYRTGPEAAF